MPLKSSLFILARDPTRFINLYQKNVLQYVKDKGFKNKLNQPIPIYQSSDCLYAPLPPLSIKNVEKETKILSI